MDGVAPFAMEGVALKVDLRDFFIADDNLFGTRAAAQLGPDAKACCGGRAPISSTTTS